MPTVLMGVMKSIAEMNVIGINSLVVVVSVLKTRRYVMVIVTVIMDLMKWVVVLL
jgi:hypothetical protein